MRPVSHVSGDRALVEVEKVFLSAGWIVNRIASDYGEDLAVQPCMRGNLLKNRMYVQVKYIGQNRGPIRIKKEQIFLWQFLRDPFLIAGWDDIEKKAIFVWSNYHSLPPIFSGFGKADVRFPISYFRPLDDLALKRLFAHNRNAAYTEVLSDLAHWVERDGGDEELPQGLADACDRATIKIATRALVEDGVLEESPDGTFNMRKFLEEHINALCLARDIADVVEDGTETNEGADSATLWAMAIMLFASEFNYAQVPSMPLAWAMTRVLRTLLSGEAVSALDHLKQEVMGQMPKLGNMQIKRQVMKRYILDLGGAGLANEQVPFGLDAEALAGIADFADEGPH